MPKPNGETAPLVIFDLDGTLIETGPDLVDSLNHAISMIGLAPFGDYDLAHLVGQGSRVMIDRALELRGTPADEAAIEELLTAFLAFYKANIPGRSAPYPGLVAALERLDHAGMRLAVCTNKQETLARELLDALGLSHRFAAVTGGDTFPMRKPDAGHILGTIERAGGEKASAVMVGDSINDIAAARNAGIPSLAVSFGYSDVPAAKLGAARVIDHYDALTPSLMGELLNGRQAKADGGRNGAAH
ncbi:MAG TPA: HAD family hydrolase [Pararhizobium sp.]|nr:HAD family hydrolase [Pararhizobium sp.]